jgi:hypothetical protein
VTPERGGPAGEAPDRPSPAIGQEDLRRLVHGDVLVAGISATGALVAVAFLAMGRLGLVSERAAATVVIALAALIGVACFFRFGSGPRVLWRDRLIVIAPVFLVAAPAIVAVHDLGGGPVVAILSGAAGSAAAVLLGVLFGSRRA